MKLSASLKGRFGSFLMVLRLAGQNFGRNEDIKYCASLSYYTMFAIAPLLIVAIAIGSVIFGRDAINGKLFSQINGVVGTDAAIAIQEMLGSTSLRKDNLFATVLGTIVFVIGASGVFVEIQSTINRIWGLRARPKKGLSRYLVSKLWSFAMVVTVGFLAVVSLIAGSAIDVVNERLEEVFRDTTVLIFIVSHLVTLVIFTVLFSLIFKYLPDSIVVWKDALVGGLFTAVLFLIGKYVIGLYMSGTGTTSAYGAAGSLIVVLLWIFFSSVLLYFGAEFTLVYALNHGHGVQPNSFSVRVRYVEEEIVRESLEDQSSPG
jgi:membrane protein